MDIACLWSIPYLESISNLLFSMASSYFCYSFLNYTCLFCNVRW